MHVVVTGAAGFIGRHVVARLSAQGHDTLGIDRRTWKPVTGERTLVADLAEPHDDTQRALRETDGVIHLAARPGVRDPAPDIARARWRDNVLAVERVLDLTPLHVPVVAASSSSVYGGAGSLDAPRPCRETDPLRPSGGYARSKAALEARCHDRARRGGRVHIARPFTVGGEGQRPDMAFSRWMTALRNGRPATILGSADRRRDVTDVADVAAALVGLLDVPGTTTVNLGTGRTHRLDDMARTLAAVLEVPLRLRVEPAGPQEASTTRADTRHCTRLLGFTPTTDLFALLARQVTAMGAQHPSRDLRPGLARRADASVA